MQAKILKTKRQIQRLRLERRCVIRLALLHRFICLTCSANSILYDRFQEAKNSGTLENTSIPVSSLQAQLTSVPFGSLNGDLASSTSMQQHSPHAHHQHQQSHFSPSHQHISHHQPPQPPSSVFHQHQLQNDLSSQGYHPSHFITQPGLMHDGSDTLMLNALHHNLQGVDQSMSMSL